MNAKQIETKIKTYISQDCITLGMNEKCKKGEYLPINYIGINDVEILLQIQKNKCYICNEDVLVNYSSYCKSQYTLDRINGKNPHLKGNCLIACWYCNCRDFNRQLTCKNKCCPDKSVTLRKKKDVPKSEIDLLISEYNKSINGNYSPFDDYIDYISNTSCDEETGEIKRILSSSKEIIDYFDLLESLNADKYTISRRERKNTINIKEGYCECGRIEEDGSVGCTRWPSCVDDHDFY